MVREYGSVNKIPIGEILKIVEYKVWNDTQNYFLFKE